MFDFASGTAQDLAASDGVAGTQAEPGAEPVCAFEGGKQVLAAADLAHQADDHAGVDAVYEGEIGAEISLAFLRVSRGRGVELVEEEAVAGD